VLGITLALLCAGLVQAGDFEDGVAAYRRQDYATALAKWRTAAQQGDADSQANLGVIYSKGQGVAQDYKEAVRLYKLAAQQGNATAQSNLGFMYDEGQGVAQDYVEAVRWYKLAAAQGNAKAQTNLGASYAKGEGVAQDYVTAHMWLNLAAVKGGSDAVKNRDIVAEKMTRQQIAEAQKLARECQARNFKNCD
jgi:TPR repeat protein